MEVYVLMLGCCGDCAPRFAVQMRRVQAEVRRKAGGGSCWVLWVGGHGADGEYGV